MPTTADLRPDLRVRDDFEETEDLFTGFSKEELRSVLGKLIRKGKPTHAYYRQPNGNIVSYPVDAHSRIRADDKGWTLLKKYGSFDLYEQTLDSPFEVLFQRGGVEEMSVKQIIENGFHYHPPVLPRCRMILSPSHTVHTGDCYRGARPVHFPQLEGMDFGEKPVCEYGCEDRWFPTEAARQQHYRILHKDEISEQMQGKALANGVREALASLATYGLVQTSTPSPEQNAGQNANRCGFCEAEIVDPQEFLLHFQSCALDHLANVGVDRDGPSIGERLEAAEEADRTVDPLMPIAEAYQSLFSTTDHTNDDDDDFWGNDERTDS